MLNVKKANPQLFTSQYSQISVECNLKIFTENLSIPIVFQNYLKESEA